jgi:hypothetical protein
MSATFERKEIKYLITKDQKRELCKLAALYMECDKFGKSLVKNIYYDTPERILIKRSIEKPVFKEKLRIRSYNNEFNETGDVFIELKKKYKGIVYKRRIKLNCEDAICFMNERDSIKRDNQILNEISYFKKLYKGLKPSVYLSYNREAYSAKDGADLRLTFDEDLLIREYDINFNDGVYGLRIIPEDKVVLEVKTLYGLPKWLIDFFERNGIYKTSFSKYGEGHKLLEKMKYKGGNDNVA